MSDIRGKRKLEETALSQRKDSDILWISRSRLGQARGEVSLGWPASEFLSKHTGREATSSACKESPVFFLSTIFFLTLDLKCKEEDCMGWPFSSLPAPNLNSLLLSCTSSFLQTTWFRSPRITGLRAVGVGNAYQLAPKTKSEFMSFLWTSPI